MTISIKEVYLELKEILKEEMVKVEVHLTERTTEVHLIEKEVHLTEKKTEEDLIKKRVKADLTEKKIKLSVQKENHSQHLDLLKETKAD
jgi:hypothetical protein